MIVLPTFPPAPDRVDDPDTFILKADNHVAFLPTWSAAVQSLGDLVEVLQGQAAASQLAAAASAAAALVSEAAAFNSAAAAASNAGATIWVTGTTYAVGDVRWSPANRVTYRRLTNGAGSTDPSSDMVNWAPLALRASITRLALINQGVI